MADLIPVAGARAIVAARAGLGTINHILLTLEALTRRNVDIAGVVMVQTRQAETPWAMVEENIEAVEQQSGIPVLCTVPVLEDFAHAGDAAVQALRERLQL
jgi:dethiobiotin synthetase